MLGVLHFPTKPDSSALSNPITPQIPGLLEIVTKPISLVPHYTGGCFLWEHQAVSNLATCGLADSSARNNSSPLFCVQLSLTWETPTWETPPLGKPFLFLQERILFSVLSQNPEWPFITMFTTLPCDYFLSIMNRSLLLHGQPLQDRSFVLFIL